MRVSEAIALDRQDVDLDDGVLNIRRTKFGKSRLVPVHASTCDALRGYATARDHVVPTTATPGFFVGERGCRITGCAVRYNFAQVLRSVGLRPRDGRRHGHGPRLHDLRHRFAAQTLVEWYSPATPTALRAARAYHVASCRERLTRFPNHHRDVPATADQITVGQPVVGSRPGPDANGGTRESHLELPFRVPLGFSSWPRCDAAKTITLADSPHHP